MAHSRTWRPLEISPHAGAEPVPEGLVQYLDDLAEIADLAELLAKEKAILFRGFGIDRAAAETISTAVLAGGTALTPTDQRPRRTLPPLNAGDPIAPPVPRLLLFAEHATDGALMLTDCAAWFGSLDIAMREAFADGIRYTENLHDGLGPGRTWQDRFGTDVRKQVESRLDEDGVHWRWTSDGLRISYIRPVTALHPLTGEQVWLDRFGHWYPTAVEELPGDLVRADERPSSAQHADGTPIPAAELAHLAARAKEATVDVPLRSGDLVLVDNVLLAHGRRPFGSRRRVFRALSR